MSQTTQLPVAKENLKQLEEHLIHGKHDPSQQQNEIIWASAKGATLTDVNGEEYIDAQSGLFNVSLGHGRTELAETISKQISTIDFAATLSGYSLIPPMMLADKLVSIANKEGLSDMNSVYFTNGGSEAVESAMHLALRYWEAKGHKTKSKFIAFTNCYHGSTFLSASLNPRNLSFGLGRLTGDRHQFVFNVEFPNELFMEKSHIKQGESAGKAASRLLEETIAKEGADNIAAFIFEPIQGDGGCVLPHPDFWPLMQQICKKNNILLIADEILTFTKTGKWFAVNHWGVKPDMITIAKSVSSGCVPLGGVILSKDVKSVALEKKHQWMHDFTTSGHPVCTAVGLKVLDLIEKENHIPLVAQKGEIFLQQLKDKLGNLGLVRDVRGKGFLFGVDFHFNVAPEISKRLVHEFKILAQPSSNEHVITLNPTFVTTQEQWTRVVDSMYNVISSMKMYSAGGYLKEKLGM